MGEQESLPFAKGSDTSRAAAKSMQTEAAILRDRIYRAIETSDKGMTCDEVEAKLGLTHQTASARVNELMNTDRIIDSQQRRDTRSGRKAVVWIPSTEDPTELEKVKRRRVDRLLNEIGSWSAPERAEMIQELVLLWCSECGDELYEDASRPCPGCGARP